MEWDWIGYPSNFLLWFFGTPWQWIVSYGGYLHKSLWVCFDNPASVDSQWLAKQPARVSPKIIHYFFKLSNIFVLDMKFSYMYVSWRNDWLIIAHDSEEGEGVTYCWPVFLYTKRAYVTQLLWAIVKVFPGCKSTIEEIWNSVLESFRGHKLKSRVLKSPLMSLLYGSWNKMCDCNSIFTFFSFETPDCILSMTIWLSTFISLERDTLVPFLH